MSYQEQTKTVIKDSLKLVETMREVDPWFPIQTFYAYLLICHETRIKKRILRGVELAELMRTTQASATRNIQLLCKYNLIQVHPNPMNKVDKLISLTDEGKRKMFNIKRILNKGGEYERKTQRK